MITHQMVEQVYIDLGRYYEEEETQEKINELERKDDKFVSLNSNYDGCYGIKGENFSKRYYELNNGNIIETHYNKHPNRQEFTSKLGDLLTNKNTNFFINNDEFYSYDIRKIVFFSLLKLFGIKFHIFDETNLKPNTKNLYFLTKKCCSDIDFLYSTCRYLTDYDGDEYNQKYDYILGEMLKNFGFDKLYEKYHPIQDITKEEFVKLCNKKIFDYFEKWDNYGIVQYCNAGTMAYPREEKCGDDRNVDISYIYYQIFEYKGKNLTTLINKVMKSLDDEFKKL